MKALLILLCSDALFLNVSSVSAQGVTITPPAQVNVQTQSNEFTVESEPSTVVTLLKNFITGLDSFLGGFIFYTPDTLGDTITLKDGSEIPGVVKYRNIFHQIAIPVVAIAIAAIAFLRIGSDNAHHLKSFATRFIVTIALFLVVPSILSYSIQFNNLLIKNISEATSYTTFLHNYFDKAEQEIVSNNESSEKYGIPSFDMSMRAEVFRSVGKFIVQIFLFAITFYSCLEDFSTSAFNSLYALQHFFSSQSSTPLLFLLRYLKKQNRLSRHIFAPGLPFLSSNQHLS